MTKRLQSCVLGIASGTRAVARYTKEDNPLKDFTMNYKILANGNLEISLNRGDKRDIRELVESNPHDGIFMAELLEHTGWSPNGQLYQVNANDVGGLTDAPILTDERDFADDGTVTVRGRVWWYPNYAVKHFGKELLETGRTVFQVAPSIPESAYT
jgi:hypothetical protein